MPKGSRVGDACIYKSMKTRCWEKGYLLFWGKAFEEFDDGPVEITVAVIEDDATGDVRHVTPPCLSFKIDGRLGKPWGERSA